MQGLDARVDTLHQTIRARGLPPSRVPCLRLPALRPDPAGRPVVRLFVGTEIAQQHAERIFVWSILQNRDPARTYEITLMRDLKGFRRLGWATEFSNYRFAVPHLAEGHGKVIYNDVDQIYRRDPALLFDLELGEAGYGAIGPRETSVMLLDRERMADVWPIQEIVRGRRRALVDRAEARPELFAPIDPGWNTRDEDAIALGDAHLYHFTTLHTQPWRPFPERFVYHEHPHGALWWELRRTADEAGFHVFERERPSFAFPAAMLPEAPVRAPRWSEIAARLVEAGVRDAWVVGDPADAEACRGAVSEEVGTALDARPIALAGLTAEAAAAEGRDAVVCTPAIDRCSADDVPWILAELFARARSLVIVEAGARAPHNRPRWQPPLGTVRTEDWWVEQLEIAATRHPGLRWQLRLTVEGAPGAGRVERHGGAWPSGRAPRVWLVSSGDAAADAAIHALAAGLEHELGAECERHALPQGGVGGLLPGWRAVPGLSALRGRGSAARWSAEERDRLANDPPDLVIAAGASAAPAARSARRLSRHRASAVQLDVDGASATRDLDLVLTPALQAPLAEPKRLELCAPLRPTRAALCADACGERLVLALDAGFVAGAKEPDRWSSELGERLAKRAEGLSALAVVAARPDVPARVVAGIRAALPAGSPLFRWTEPDALIDLLGEGDRVVLACASDDAVAALLGTGLALELAPLPPAPRERPRPKLRAAIARSAARRPGNDRGTTRPQIGLETAASMLLASGLATQAPDAARRARRILARELATPFGADTSADAGSGSALDWDAQSSPQSDLALALARVRRLLERPSGSDRPACDIHPRGGANGDHVP